jgi:hypothetical protein
MPMPSRPRLRKREILFAVTMGALAAGATAIVLDDHDGALHRVAVEVKSDKTYEVGQFDEISTVGPQDVVVTRGDKWSIRSEGSPEALALLEVVEENGELTIRPKGEYRFGFDWDSLRGATFYVTVPKLERVSMAGSGDIRIDRIESDSFTGSIAGSGELAIADMKVDEADFSIGGEGSIIAAGTAREARVAIGGSGEVKAAGLRSQDASISIGGQGDIELTVEDKADISIMGQGDVDITGPARCSLSRFGRGEVRCNGVELE